MQDIAFQTRWMEIKVDMHIIPGNEAVVYIEV